MLGSQADQAQTEFFIRPCARSGRRRPPWAPKVARVRKPLLERVWSKFDFHPSGCWIWKAATNKGYGVVNSGGRGKALLAHQVVWKLLRGDPPPGLEPDHLCLVKLCVNPGHLEWVTKAENGRRASRMYWDSRAHK